MSNHRDALLIINTEGTHDALGDRPTVGDAGEAVLHGFRQACERLGKEERRHPGAILLQEYHWVTIPSLVAIVKTLNDETQSDWKIVRQWSGKSTGKMAKYLDTVLLYDTGKYDGYEFKSTDHVCKSIQSSMSGRLQGMLAGCGQSSSILSYTGRWAGAVLAIRTAERNQVPPLQFLLFSYHGRSNGELRKGENKKKACPSLQPDIKRVLTQDFVVGIGRMAKAMPLLKPYEEQHGMPALIGGDWNSSYYSSIDDTAFRKKLRAEGLREPPGELEIARLPHHESVRLVNNDIDYAVPVNIREDQCAPCEIEILKSEEIAHMDKHRRQGKFDHNIIMVTFEIRPLWHTTTSSPDCDATEAHVTQGNVRDVHDTGADAQARRIDHVGCGLEGVLESAGSSRKKITIAGEAFELDSENGKEIDTEPEYQLVHCRNCHEDFSKPADKHTLATLKKTVGAMAKDALRMPDGARKPDYIRARNQPWWPAGEPADAVIRDMDKDALKFMYDRLKEVLAVGCGTTLDSDDDV